MEVVCVRATFQVFNFAGFARFCVFVVSVFLCFCVLFFCLDGVRFPHVVSLSLCRHLLKYIACTVVVSYF